MNLYNYTKLFGINSLKTFLHDKGCTFSTIKKMSGNIIWIDLEMTGLDVEKDKILEIATIVTDPELNIIAEGPDIIIHQDKTVLDNMGPWCIEHHAKTGLTQASLDSKIDIKTAESRTLDFLKKYTFPGRCPLAGNSCYMDRMFIMKEMPSLTSHLHYRNIDVSTVKELCKMWYPQVFRKMEKKLLHRALSDIKESIDELKFYRENIMIKL